jgi:hypothetical protein
MELGFSLLLYRQVLSHIYLLLVALAVRLAVVAQAGY